MFELVTIWPTANKNALWQGNPQVYGTVVATMEYYNTIGFNPPWIGYLVLLDGELVGSAGFKGKPIENRVEIAYGTLPAYTKRGHGTKICRLLVAMALAADTDLIITAKTLPDNIGSIRILEKNNFRMQRMVFDEDDGNVCEWVYQKEPE